MPRNNTLYRDTADQLRPTGTATDRYGNVSPTGGQTEIATGVKVGLIPATTENASIGSITGDVADIRRWDVALDGRVDVRKGDAFVVAAGDNPGTYRVQVITRGLSRRDPTLCLALKE